MGMIGNYRRLTADQLNHLLRHEDQLDSFLYDQEVPLHLVSDVDKAWHGIHFLLNGDPWEGEGPLYDAVLGGEAIGETDGDYGPTRYLTPDGVRATAEALPAPEEFIARYAPTELNDAEIYPVVWEDDEEDREYLLDNYRVLVTFFQAAAEAGDALLLWIA